jgi:hypothetical protein
MNWIAAPVQPIDIHRASAAIQAVQDVGRGNQIRKNEHGESGVATKLPSCLPRYRRAAATAIARWRLAAQLGARPPRRNPSTGRMA